MAEVVVVGCGEVGLAHAEGLLGLDPPAGVHLLDPAPGGRAEEFAERSGLVLHRAPGGWLAAADVVLLAVPGGVARAALDGLVPFLRGDAVVADLSTATAESKRSAAEVCRAGGLGYADLAITGSVALGGARTPLLYAGPRHSVLIDLLSELGAPVTVLEDAQPGDAVRVKLLRSVLMKGLEALVVECVPAAERYGVLDQLWTSLGDVDRTGFVPLLQAMLRTHPQHAARREHEIAQAAEQLEAVSCPSAMTRAAQQRFTATLAAHRTEAAPGDPARL